MRITYPLWAALAIAAVPRPQAAGLIKRSHNGSTNGQAKTQSRVPPPADDPFYQVPDDIEKLQPGTVLRHRAPPSPIAYLGHAADQFVQQAYQILYRTTDKSNKATATVVTVLIPPKPDPSKVVMLEIAEDSASVNCAPSFGFQNASLLYPELDSTPVRLQLLVAEDLLNRGWLVIVPDIHGPKGTSPPNELGAYSSLDAVRATLNAGQLTGVKQDARFAIWGYSGGAAAGLATVQVMPSYAPELNIVAAAIGGGAGKIPASFDLVASLNKTPGAGLIVLAIVGLAAQDADVYRQVMKHLKPEYRNHFFQVHRQCLEANTKTYINEDVLAMFDDPAFLKGLELVSRPHYANLAPTVPIYWYQSAIDRLVPAYLAQTTFEGHCAHGANIHFVLDTIPNVTHTSYSIYSTERSLDWLGDALQGRKPPAGCSNETIRSKDVPLAFTSIFPPDIQAELQKIAAPRPVK